MIRALIFDFDGLILDTELPDFQSWQELYRQHGFEFAQSDFAQVIGSVFEKGSHPLDRLEALLGSPVNRAALTSLREQREAELIAAQSVLPGVEDYLADAKRLGLKLAVASSSEHAWVDGHLTRLGLYGNFDAIRCREDVAQPKPAPDLFLAALDALDLKPHEAIVLEDSPHGVTAANRAGVYCVAVPNPLTRQLPLDHADLRLESLAHLPLERLLARVNGHSPKSDGG